jgi:hypothetical protein
MAEEWIKKATNVCFNHAMGNCTNMKCTYAHPMGACQGILSKLDQAQITRKMIVQQEIKNYKKSDFDRENDAQRYINERFRKRTEM